jgi:hypothetical protein
MQGLGVDMERSIVELMHEEIKCRAYQLIERKQAVPDGNHLEGELKGELLTRFPGFRNVPTPMCAVTKSIGRRASTCSL